MNDSRGPWYLLTGLIFGLVIGLVYAWLISPVTYTDSGPDTLRPEYKDQYRIMIAQAFLANGDIGRAIGRLELLQDNKPALELGSQAQRILAQGGSEQEAHALAQLAIAIGQPQGTPTPPGASKTGAATTPEGKTSGADDLPTATLDSNQTILTPTSAPTQGAEALPSFTPRPSATHLATMEAPFALKDRQVACDPNRIPGLLSLEARDSTGQPLSGVQVTITWDGGENLFVTGLYPNINAGYADFVMTPDLVYSLRVGEGGELVRNLSTTQCEDKSGKSYPGGWRLKFAQ